MLLSFVWLALLFAYTLTPDLERGATRRLFSWILILTPFLPLSLSLYRGVVRRDRNACGAAMILSLILVVIAAYAVVNWTLDSPVSLVYLLLMLCLWGGLGLFMLITFFHLLTYRRTLCDGERQ